MSLDLRPVGSSVEASAGDAQSPRYGILADSCAIEVYFTTSMLPIS